MSDYQQWRAEEARKAAEAAREREELQLRLPMSGPTFTNPIVWRRRLATPRGQGALLVIIAIFLLLKTWYDVTSRAFYSVSALVVGCVALPLGFWSLLTGASPAQGNKAWWWWSVAIPLTVAGVLIALRVMELVSP
jgi:hypothetical protein